MSDPRSPDGPLTDGQAFRAYLQSALAVLTPLTALGYFQERLPGAPDEALAEIVNVFTAWAQPQRERFLAALPEDKRGLFAIFGHRAATLSIRQLRPEWLRLGLVGFVMAHAMMHDAAQIGRQGGAGPDAAPDAALAVFYHCARMLEIEPVDLFDEAAGYAPAELALRMRAFGRREDVVLKQFGWRKIQTPDGVRFKFEWG
jgi:hypothetical protein